MGPFRVMFFCLFWRGDTPKELSTGFIMVFEAPRGVLQVVRHVGDERATGHAVWTENLSRRDEVL